MFEYVDWAYFSDRFFEKKKKREVRGAPSFCITRRRTHHEIYSTLDLRGKQEAFSQVYADTTSSFVKVFPLNLSLLIPDPRVLNVCEFSLYGTLFSEYFWLKVFAFVIGNLQNRNPVCALSN